ncbi:unnamed protein product, partial [Rotaria socialis]
KEIKLEKSDQSAYYIPTQSSIQQILYKPDALTTLIKNINRNVNHNAIDTDLMFNNRHALLFQLYIDDIELTNPIGDRNALQSTENFIPTLGYRNSPVYLSVCLSVTMAQKTNFVVRITNSHGTNDHFYGTNGIVTA